jgi:ACS family D-galactonate transporter-like MFS transporter
MSMTGHLPRTRKRFGILLLIFVSVWVNYMDRVNIAVAGPALREDLGLSHVQMGLVFAAFGWTYSLLQIPGGVLVDLVRTRVLYGAIMFLWSAATVVQGMVNSTAALMGCRMAIGIFEAPSYSANNKMVTSWFPDRERAIAISIYTSGQFLGLAAFSPLLFALQAWVGWRGLFFVTGAVGIIWAAVMYFRYRDPRDHPTVNAAELDYIAKGGGLVGERKETAAAPERRKFQWQDVRLAFSYRRLWGIYIGQYCMGAAFQFFLTWFPTYLKESRGLSLLSSGFWGAVPYLGAFAGVLIAGFSSDFLVRRGWSMSTARKLPVLCGMLLMMVILGANYTSQTSIMILFLTVSFFGNGLASIGWVFVSSMAPVKLIGVVGGVFNFCGSLSGATIPIIIGWLARDGSFEPVFVFISVMSALGFCSYLFLVGKVERIVLPDTVTTGTASEASPAQP